jgi:FkbM family methyltransferase
MKLLKLPNRQKIYVVDKFNALDIYKEIYEENIYFREGLDIQPGATVIDIGGNVGLFSLYALQKIPQIRLITIEPIPLNFDVLQANIQKFQPQQASVSLLNIGLAEKEKTAEFDYYPHCPSDSTATPFDMEKQVQMFLVKMKKGFGRLLPKKLKNWAIRKFLGWLYTPIKVQCQLKTFSQIVAEQKLDRIDFVKLDAENAEREIVMGIADEDWKKIRQMSIEVHTNIPGGETLMDDFTELLKSKGFSVVSDFNSRFSYVGVHMIYAKKNI